MEMCELLYLSLHVSGKRPTCEGIETEEEVEEEEDVLTYHLH